MKLLWLSAIFAISSVALSSVTLAAAQAAGPAASINMLPGTWNCTTHGSTGTSTGMVTFTQVTPNLVQFHWATTSGKNAGHKGGGEWFYDSTKSEYVAMGAGSGGWGVSRGSADADATTVTLKDTYPDDPTNGTTVYHFAASTIGFTSDWKKDGKPMHIAQTCTKA
jgi:outer membrane lipoprotein-sorting protein